MSGVTICSWCNSASTQQGLDQVQCLDCGLVTGADGTRQVPFSQTEEGITVEDITAPPTVDNTQPEPDPALPELVAPVEPDDEEDDDA